MRPIARVAAGLMLLTVGVCSAARPASPMGPRPAARPPAASPSRAALSRPAAAARSPIVARGTAPVGSGTSPIRRTASDDHDPAFPDFASLRPFSAQTQYMSRLGYVRYWIHQHDGRWITYAEAVKIMMEPRRAKRVRA